MTSSNVLHVLRTARLPILAQLHIEEALFRSTSNNYLLVNDGVESPTIVLGISGKPEALVHQDRALAMGIPMVKRFTGGGTVVVDEDSIMTSVIIGGGARRFGVECFPRQIMEWTHGLLTRGANVGSGEGGQNAPINSETPLAFTLCENDFTVGSRKIGGNAQAISGDKFLQHTSFLWDYKDERMALLKNPEKQPAYRERREHEGFVQRLKRTVGDDIDKERIRFVDGLIDSCARGVDWDDVVDVSVEEVLSVLRAYQDSRQRPGKQVLLGSRYVS